MTNIFYNLKQIEILKLTDLKSRMIQYRLKLLIKSNTIKIGEFCYKDRLKNKWQIHISLIKHFQPVRRRIAHTTPLYVNEISINLKDNYDINFYEFLGKSIVEGLLPDMTFFTIEQGTNFKDYHIHLGTTATIKNIINVLTAIGGIYNINIIENKNTLIAPIREKVLFNNYTHKADLTSDAFIPQTKLNFTNVQN